MGRTSRKRTRSEDILAGTLVHLPEPPNKKRKLDNMENVQTHDPTDEVGNHDTTVDDGSHYYLTTPTPTPRCENPAVEHTALGELLYHKSTRILQARLVASGIPDYANSIPKLFNYLFLSSPFPYYEKVCFRRPKPTLKDWRAKRNTYHPRSSIHLAIFTYILKRISCLPIIEAEGYTINHHYSSATDAAFVYFLTTLVRRPGTWPEPSGPNAVRTLLEKSETHCTALVIEDERAHRAFEIFTQHPFRFLVQMKVGHNLLKEEVAVVWCPHVGTEGGWDVVWEYMTKDVAKLVCPNGNYEF